MPWSSPQECAEVGCHRLVRGVNRCEEHIGPWRQRQEIRERARRRVRQRGRTKDPYYDTSAWRKRRAAHLERYPACVVCGRKADTADHIHARGRGGRDDGPLQSMCRSCHGRKSAASDGGFGNPIPI